MAVPVKAAEIIMNNVFQALQSKKNLNSIHDWFIKANTKNLYFKKRIQDQFDF